MAPERRSVHRTQWAAQFAVASELCKRDYQVALTLGNHPMVDLMVISPNGLPFLIDVKGLYKRNFWAVRQQQQRDNLFYVFAYVPDVEKNRFFVMKQQEVNDAIQAALTSWRARRLAEGTLNQSREFPGVDWKVAEAHENAWEVLPR